jgi:hypothetical protein
MNHRQAAKNWTGGTEVIDVPDIEPATTYTPVVAV